MKTVSILIPIHNRLEITKKGLFSLDTALKFYNEYGGKAIDYKIVVIDDGSRDGSKEYISNTYRDIHLVEGDGSLWWTGSMREGTDYAVNVLKSDYLLLWNDDIFPDQNYFLVVETVLNDQSFDDKIIGSKIVYYGSPEKIWSAGGYFNKFTGKFGMKNRITKHKEKFIKCDWQPGMGTLIPTSKVLSMGIKWDDKRFPQYHGDSDFTLQCKSNGLTVLTYLDLVINNNTETSGFRDKKNLNDIYKSLTSIKSGNNIIVDIKFYLKHGYMPFAFLGLFLKYFYFLGGYVKHSVFKL